MAGSFYRGTSINQDGRFTNKEKKLIQAKTWPEIFDQRIDLTKVDIKVMKQWVGKKITEILGFEDELVINLAISEVESCDEKGPNPKKIQLNLTGFLENKTPVFMKELWELLLDAQNSTNGIPVSFVDEKRNEIKDKMDALESQMSEIQNIENLILGITPASQRIKNESNPLGDSTLTGFAKADAKTDGKLKEFDDFLKNYDSKEKNNDITDDKPPRDSDVRHKRDSDVGRSRDDRHKKSSHRDKDTDRYRDHRDRDRRDDRRKTHKHHGHSGRHRDRSRSRSRTRSRDRGRDRGRDRSRTRSRDRKRHRDDRKKESKKDDGRKDKEQEKEKADRTQTKPDKPEKTEKPEKPDKIEKIEKIEKLEKSPKDDPKKEKPKKKEKRKESKDSSSDSFDESSSSTLSH